MRRAGYTVASISVTALLLAGCSLPVAGPASTVPSPTIAADPTTATPTPMATSTPTAEPTSKPTSKPTKTAPPPLLQRGDRGEKVRELQHRLRQLDWFAGVDHRHATARPPTKGVKGFQGKRKLAETGDGRPAHLARRWSR